jgi:hypothetical protein
MEGADLLSNSPFTMALTLRRVIVNVISNYMYFSTFYKLFPLANVRM